MHDEPLNASLGLAFAFVMAGAHMLLAIARALGLIGHRGR